MPSPPSVIGRYQVRERLGQGGMGALYLALDPAIDRLVALKLLRIDSEEMRARFLREARSAGRLQHPHIVTIYDVGEHDGQPFIAMEYIKGETLAELVQRRAPLTLTRKLTLMEDLCEGLEYAHVAGLVHRDIKPANLMITGEAGVLKILDFGIARGSGDSGLTEVGTMMGTPNYMSPEQASGKRVDHRSDIFSVGSVIYEMLVYRQAFPGKDWQVVLPSILEKSPEPLTEVDRGLSPRLEAIVGRSLTRNPGERYQDLSTLGNDLANFRRQLEDAAFETALPTPTPIPARAKNRPLTDQSRLAALRKEKLGSHLATAEDALSRGDIKSAQTAAEDASLLDADNTQVLELVAQVHDAHERAEIEGHLTAASEQLDAQSLTQALHHVDQALELQPTAPAARQLRQKVAEAIEARDRRRQRSQLIERALRTAREALTAGTPEAAIRSVSEVLAYEPGHPEASKLKQQALRAAEDRRRQEAIEREVQQAIEAARRAFAEGDHTAAIERLEPLEATHPAVAATLAELRAEAAAVKRQIEIAAEDLNPEQLAARQRREAHDYVARAREKQTEHDYPSALGLIDAALALSAEHPDATQLRAEIEDQRAAEEARREAEAAERRRTRQREIGALLDAADTALQTGTPEDALRQLEQINRNEVTTTQATRLHALLRDAEARRHVAQEETERRHRLAGALERAGTAFDDDRLPTARRLVESVLVERPDDEAAQTLLQRVTAAETHAQKASDVVSQALESAAQHEYVKAVALLESFDPSHPLVDQTLEHLRTEQAVQTRERRRDETRKVVRDRITAFTSPIRSAFSDRPLAAFGGSAAALVVLVVSVWLLRSPAAPPAPTETASIRAPEATATSSLPTRTPSAAPATTSAEAAELETRVALEERPTPQVNPLDEQVLAIVALAEGGDFAAALTRLDALDAQDARVASARTQVEDVWNTEAQDVADRSRQLAATGNFAQAMVLLDGFTPGHGFVDAARQDVTRDLDTDAAAVSRRALEMAAAGEHDAAVGLLRAYTPAHAAIMGTIDELLANPDCPAEQTGVREGLVALSMSPGVAEPQTLQMCDGPFRIEVQNEQVRFGAGCRRASVAAFVPVFCEGGSEWSEPFLLRFFLTKRDGDWQIDDAVELDKPEP